MIRTFSTHVVRPQRELTGTYWSFTPCQGEHAGKVYQVPTPSCWESIPDFGLYRGEGLYTTQFEACGNIRLEFKGISHTAMVYLDGVQIASHYNAYTAFSTIVKGLNSGVHTLTVRADNRFSQDSALHIPNDYMSYGGVSRPVVLENIGDVYLSQVHVTPFQANGVWHAEIVIRLANISETPHNLTVETELAEQRFRWDDVEIGAHDEILLNKRLTFDNVQQWLPGDPRLYTVSTTVYEDGHALDDLIDRIGFRQVTLSGKKILLNGRPLRIKGVCRHEDHPQFGSALPYAAMAADLELIKHIGANSVRAVHYPNDEVFLDLCDEQGILVWEENHARGLSLENMRNPNFEPQAKQVIQEMIPLHHNHPCIFIWGILNECASDIEYGRTCYQTQLELVKSLDPSRPHSFASCKFKTDICFDLPDVVSYNIYPMWYHETPVEEYLDDLYQWVQQETGGAGKPFLITEIGAGGIYGYRNAYHGKWTEEYQAETLAKQVKAVLEHPDCSGVYVWQFCDIRISEEWFGGRPRTMNNKGIVDEYRRQKLSYQVVRELFQKYPTFSE